MRLTGKGTASMPQDRQITVRTVQILRDLIGCPSYEFGIRLWDGAVVAPSGPPRFTLILTHPGALRRMLLPPTEVAVGDAFLRGDFDVDGDLEAAVEAAAHVISARRPLWAWVVLAARLLSLPQSPRAPRPLRARLRGRPHSLARDRAAVRHHYDVGNDFWALWLDRRMVYSCAYFPTGTEDLDAAQEAKLEHVCRKLRLRPGERLLDIGCGWGGLVIYAAQRFGVRAVGVTLSELQARWAQARIAEAGLAHRCEVHAYDYREVAGEPFDKIASVGMFEHVGGDRLPEYFGKAFSLLRPGGLFLNHGIAIGPLQPKWPRLGRWASFIDAHVFPDGELVSTGRALAAAEAAGFEVRDVESLREHYVRTLRLWVRRLEARRAEAVTLAGEATYRTWRLFMAGSAQGFVAGRTTVVQTVLARPAPAGRVRLPWSRADLYDRAGQVVPAELVEAR